MDRNGQGVKRCVALVWSRLHWIIVGRPEEEKERKSRAGNREQLVRSGQWIAACSSVRLQIVLGPANKGSPSANKFRVRIYSENQTDFPLNPLGTPLNGRSG